MQPNLTITFTVGNKTAFIHPYITLGGEKAKYGLPMHALLANVWAHLSTLNPAWHLDSETLIYREQLSTYKSFRITSPQEFYRRHYFVGLANVRVLDLQEEEEEESGRRVYGCEEWEKLIACPAT